MPTKSSYNSYQKIKKRFFSEVMKKSNMLNKVIKKKIRLHKIILTNY